MEQLSNEQREEIAKAGAALESSEAWAVAQQEINRRMDGIVTTALCGRLETHEEYLAKRAEYVALMQVRDLPKAMQDTGAP